MRTLLFLLGTLMMNAVIADMNYKHPLFLLEFNIFGAGAEIKLNDIPILYIDAEGRTVSEKPVPESIIDGKNIISIKTFPVGQASQKFSPDSYVEALIVVREKEAPLNQKKTLLHVKINPANTEDQIFSGSIKELGSDTPKLISRSENEIVAERFINIKSPFPRWAWQDGATISNTQDEYASLLHKYKEVWGALNSGDMEKIKIIYGPAAQEFATAYSYKDKNEGHRLMSTGAMVGDKDWVLGDIDKFLQKRKYIMKVHANGKIAEIVDTQDLKSPIMYLNPKSKLISFQKFSFYKNQSGEWIMIR